MAVMQSETQTDQGDFDLLRNPTPTELPSPAYDPPVLPPPADPFASAPSESAAALPQTYGTGSLFLLGRDPSTIFVFWDAAFTDTVTGGLRLELRREDGGLVTSRSVQPNENHWLLELSTPGTNVFAELILDDPQRGPVSISRSETVPTMSAGFSNDTSARFALIPFSLAFDRLIALRQIADLRHFSLADLLSEISSTFSPSGQSTPAWSDEQRAVLDALVGSDIIERFAGDSEAIERLFRKALQDLGATSDSLFSGIDWSRLVSLSSPGGGAGGS